MAHLRIAKLPTRAALEARRTKLELDHHLYGVLADTTLLAWILAGGKACYLKVFLHEFRGYPVDRQMGELLWLAFTQAWLAQHPGVLPGDYLDALHVETPPTQREVEDAWVVDSASSDDARRYFGMA